MLCDPKASYLPYGYFNLLSPILVAYGFLGFEVPSAPPRTEPPQAEDAARAIALSSSVPAGRRVVTIAAFERLVGRGQHGKVVLEVGAD